MTLAMMMARSSMGLRAAGSIALRQSRLPGSSLGVRGFAALPSHTKLTLPALSPTMSEGVIANWLKNEGDFVEAGQPVCEIETDKATVDFEVQDDGYLAKILVQAGGPPQPVGEIIGVLVEDKADVAAFANVTLQDVSSGASSSSSAAPEPAQESAPAPPAAPVQAEKPVETKKPVESSSASGDRVFASPLARKMLAENGVDLYALPKGSGPNGRIVKADVEAYLASPQAQSAGESASESVEEPATETVVASASGDYFDKPVAADAQTLAAQYEASKFEIPHYYLNCEVDVSELLKIREQLNAKLPEKEQVAVNDFVVRAAALAMKAVPDVNSSWGKTFIRQYRNCDINVAALVSPEDGVLMPVIRNADRKGLAAISAEMRSFVSDEDDAEIDLGVGTFTISNMGAYGIKTYTPIVRSPQGSSLGVGAITRRAVPVAGNVAADLSQGPPVRIVPTMTVTLSSDHRVVDGAVGAQWLQHFKNLLESPVNMLL